MNADAPIRIVIVDDPLMREGLRAPVASLSDIEVVGEAGDGEAARRAPSRTRSRQLVALASRPGFQIVQPTSHSG